MHHEESSAWNSATQKNSATLKKEQHEISATWKECNAKKVLHGNSKIRKECNTEKVQYEMNATWRNSKTWKECNKEKVQHENSATQTNYSDSVKFRKNCTRRVRKNAQMHNGPSVNGPLYTGLNRVGVIMGSDDNGRHGATINHSYLSEDWTFTLLLPVI